MRERDFTWPRVAAAADQRDGARRVVRCAIRTRAPSRRARTCRRATRSTLRRAPPLRTMAAGCPGSRCASIDFPVPGGPSIKQAVRARCGDGERSLRGFLAAHVREIGASPRRVVDASGDGSERERATRGRSDGRKPRGASTPDRPSHRGRAPLPPRSRPAARRRGRRAARTTPSAALREWAAALRPAPIRRRIPYAATPCRESGPWPRECRWLSAGRSGPTPSGRSAGARLTVILRAGNSNCAFCSAARTRSRDSLTSVSGRPTRLNAGNPPARCTSTVTSGASSPARPRESTTASAIAVLGVEIAAGVAADRAVSPAAARYAAGGGNRASNSATRFSSASSFSRVLRSTSRLHVEFRARDEIEAREPGREHRFHVFLDVLRRRIFDAPCRCARRVRRSCARSAWPSSSRNERFSTGTRHRVIASPCRTAQSSVRPSARSKSVPRRSAPAWCGAVHRRTGMVRQTDARARPKVERIYLTS